MKIIKTKKAGVGMLAGIIFILACAALMTAFLIRTQMQARGKLDIEACAISVAWIDKTKQMMNLNNCYTYDLGEIKTETKKATINNILDRVKDCWHEFGAGQKDPWANWVYQDSRCFVAFQFTIPYEITRDEFIAEVNKREDKDFLLSASIATVDDKNYFLIDSIDFDKGSFFSLGIAKFNSFRNLNELEPKKDYGIIFWFVPATRDVQLISGIKGKGYAIISPMKNARKNLDCSQLYYIPAK